MTVSVWRAITHGVRVLTRRAAADAGLADELQHYFEQATAEAIARGVPPDEARRMARLEIGSPAAVRDEVRESGWENVLESLAADARYAVRQLYKNRGFAVTAILILALGIAATTAIFTILKPVLLEPLPYPHPDRIVTVWERRDTGGRMLNFANYQALAGAERSFEALAVTRVWDPAVTGPAMPERLHGQRVSFAYFRTLGVPPIVGRDFQPADDRLRAPAVVIVSHALWLRRYAADPTIAGRQVILDDRSFTVVGVMPAGFENVLAPEADVWTPLQYDSSLPVDGKEWGHHLRMVGRLRPGATRAQARSEMEGIRATLTRTYAPGYAVSGGPPDGFIVHSLQSDVVADVQPVMLAVAGSVVLVLLIACVNVANLLLARFSQRRAEFSLRAALGAGRLRLIRQLLTEVLVLTVIGGGLGVLAAQYAVNALVAISPPELPRLTAIHVDYVVLGFAVLVTMTIATGVGVFASLHMLRDPSFASMKDASPRFSGSRRGTRQILVIAEVALALVLLVGAGLLWRSVERLFAVSPGFDASHLLTMQVQESARRFATAESRHRFFDEALEAVRRLPGVEAAAFTSQLPLSGDFDSYGIEFEKDNGASGGPAFRYAITPGYLDAMRIPLRRGRPLDAHDTAGAPVAIVISEALAAREFGGRDPIGQRVHVGPDIGRPERPWATIVGVAGNVKQASLTVAEADAFYVTARQWPFPDLVLSLVVRGHGDVESLAPAVRRAIWSVDKDQPIVRLATMDRLLAASEARRRFALVVFEVFALAGLLLAATGILGVLSLMVTERTREIGVRAALGASRSAVVRLIVWQGMLLTGVGTAIGLAGAAVASRALTTLLFGISRLDPITYVGVIAVVFVVAAIACGLPASRAARVDPSIALRAE